MNYKTCYHRRRNRYHRRCCKQKKLIDLFNTIIILSICIIFIGVLVAHAATIIELTPVSNNSIERPKEVSTCSIVQTSNEIHNNPDVQQLEVDEVKVSPTPLLIDEPQVDEETNTDEYVEEIIDCTIDEFIGEENFVFEGNTFKGYDMPTVYYPSIDYSFEPYMDYRCITNKSSPAYAISHSEKAYTDEYGLRRYVTDDDQFKVNGQDDYIIALGTYYKPKGECGSRYLIVTTTGMFTIITGDEKADRDTDERNMFSLHDNGTCAGIVEWIVDTNCLETTMKRAGTITAGPVEALKGEITHIYRIN